MSSSPPQHAYYRELLSAELDGALAVEEKRQLELHLAACPACRLVEREYRQQRRQLQALGPPPPPRDLWARTSLALDREVARGGAGRRVEPWRPRAALLGSAAALSLGLALVSTQLGLVPGGERGQSPVAGIPTPFGVSPQRIHFLGADASGLVLYRAQVDRVCPASALGCHDQTDVSPQALRLPANSRPANLSLSPNGELAAITAQARDSEGVFAVTLRTTAAGPSPAPPDDPAVFPPPATAEPDLAPGGTPAQPPAVTPEDSAQTPGEAPTQTPGEAPTQTPGEAPTQNPETPEVTPDVLEPSPAASPIALTTPEAILETVAILEDVRIVGAPPSWSPSGEMLAFSAMPADGSRGPDVYVWRPAEKLAQPLTSDHRSYFASWSGERIVASRLAEPPAEASEDGPEPSLRTMVIDPLAGEEREVAGASLWLPVVSPHGAQAVCWQGDFELANNTLRPLDGGLYLLDWHKLDPFLDTAQPAEEAPDGELDDDRATSSPEPPAQRTDAPIASAQPTDEPSEPTPENSLRLLALEPERDTTDQPVLEWFARWSNDGAVLGLWVADAPRSSWGRLSVLAIDPAGELLLPEPLLQPTLARRSFSLGPDRIAWIAPSETSLDGELRVRTWGSAGDGGLRLPSFDLREVLLAF